MNVGKGVEVTSGVGASAVGVADGGGVVAVGVGDGDGVAVGLGVAEGAVVGVAEGTVDFRPAARLFTQAWLRTRDRVRRSRLRGLAHRVDRTISQARILLGRVSPFS